MVKSEKLFEEIDNEGLELDEKTWLCLQKQCAQIVINRKGENHSKEKYLNQSTRNRQKCIFSIKKNINEKYNGMNADNYI